MNGQLQPHPIFEELKKIDPNLPPILEQILGTGDAVAKLVGQLVQMYPVDNFGEENATSWELCGSFFRSMMRFHEALFVYWRLYLHLLDVQQHEGRWRPKGTPLIWMSECFFQLGFYVHANRYVMLAHCDDALDASGILNPNLGVYWRAVSRHSLSDVELERYSAKFFESSKAHSDERFFPEALLQRLDDNDSWLTALPSPQEAFYYLANPRYTRWRLDQLGTSQGHALEYLAQYLMSCMPGCRAKRRVRSRSSEYDVVCAMEGLDVDFRSELGRHFVCECKDWKSPANVTAIAKFCRVLDSTKSRFGIVFSKRGISKAAEHERRKLFLDRGIVIVSIDEATLGAITAGTNLIGILRKDYEDVRLDLK
jgi:hypothetical protein